MYARVTVLGTHLPANSARTSGLNGEPRPCRFTYLCVKEPDMFVIKRSRLVGKVKEGQIHFQFGVEVSNELIPVMLHSLDVCVELVRRCAHMGEHSGFKAGTVGNNFFPMMLAVFGVSKQLAPLQHTNVVAVAVRFSPKSGLGMPRA